jgi:hypothetical protein
MAVIKHRPLRKIIPGLPGFCFLFFLWIRGQECPRHNNYYAAGWKMRIRAKTA